MSRPPSPSAFFVLRLICFVNVFLPSPSLRADCDSYCKASKGKLKINMKKYCKKDYGECPLSRDERRQRDAGQEHPRGGVPRATQLGACALLGMVLARFGEAALGSDAWWSSDAVCPLGNRDEHTVHPALGLFCRRLLFSKCFPVASRL